METRTITQPPVKGDFNWIPGSCVSEFHVYTVSTMYRGDIIQIIIEFCIFDDWCSDRHFYRFTNQLLLVLKEFQSPDIDYTIRIYFPLSIIGNLYDETIERLLRSKHHITTDIWLHVYGVLQENPYKRLCTEYNWTEHRKDTYYLHNHLTTFVLCTRKTLPRLPSDIQQLVISYLTVKKKPQVTSEQ
jgi:hypothetical protein